VVTALETVNSYSREAAANVYAHGVNYTQEEMEYKMQQAFKSSAPPAVCSLL